MTQKEHRIIREARRLAAVSPDFKYEMPDRSDGQTWDSCRYIHDGKGSCLFGQALMNTKDITADDSPRIEFKAIESIICYLKLRVSAKQVAWASRVQELQDDGVPWGQAVQDADTCVAESTEEAPESK